jgi:uncharacterized repeat protein (TIGR01451 family)/fimbrial isopeptide formation D2 family protein/LPXTG-motif cell wall-anchored protein
VTTVVAAVLAVSGLVMLDSIPATAAGEAVSLAKRATDSVLVGGDVDYSLTAANPGTNTDAVTEYNATFRDVLPIGVTYKAGTTTPAGYGDPTVYTDPGTGQQTLVWRNVDDLAIDQTITIGFTAATDPDVLPVGAKPKNDGNVYVSSDPRLVPRFTTAGVVSDRYTAHADASATSTITAVTVAKSEPSPEHELLRGVHDHTTVYTLTVTNNTVNPTETVTVVDYLPAQLEFLGCGDVDNTSGGAVEYPGAPRLTGTPDVDPVDCPAPVSVTTVQDPDGYPAGVYTRVEWEIGDLDVAGPGGVRRIKYAAGIPMRRNVMPADPETFVSTANLDNNTGPSTRETTTEQGLHNFAEVGGTYTGPDTEGNTHFEVTDTDDLVVSAEDVAMQKSVSPGTFEQGEIATYTLELQASEYADSTGIVITDEMADGLCPLDADTNHDDESAATCAPGADFAPTGATYDSVTDEGTDGFTIVFDPIDIAQNDTSTITYQARMRADYDGSTEPTSSGDSYRNVVSLTGQTTVIAEQDPPTPVDQLEVRDASDATISSDGPQLDKTIGKNVTSMNCPDADYTDNYDGDQTDLTFTEGSRVCFKIRIDFSDGNSTRDPVLTDFMPENVTYDSGSWATHGGNNVTVSAVESDESVVFTMGDQVGSHRYVSKGGVLEVILSGTVTAPGDRDVDIAGNLAKFRWIDRDGRARSQRDQVNLYIPPPPPLAVDKQVAKIATPTDLADSQQIRQGDTVRYQVDVTNQGNDDDSNAVAADDIDVWDVLPDGFTCDDVIGSISAGGTCTDPDDEDQPSFAGSTDHSAIRWTLTSALEPGDTTSMTYDVKIPTSTSVNTQYINTAAVHTFTTPTNLGGVSADHYPENNVDTTVDPDEEDVPEAADTAFVILPAVGLTKANTTSQSDDTDDTNGDHDAVAGETVSYTIRASIPAHTTVYNGKLLDPLPGNLTFVSATAGYSATGASPAADALPDDASLDPGDGTLSLPATWTNNSSVAQVFQVDITAKVAPGYTGTGKRTNTATFTSRTTEDGSVDVDDVTATSDVEIVRPVPSIVKTSDPDSAPVAGQSVTYTLVASNGADKPTLYNAVAVDCVPAGLQVDTLDAPATQDPGDGDNGCATGETTITWPIETLAGGDSAPVHYTVTIDPDAAGGAAYANTATLTGSTLHDAGNDATVEGVLTTDDTVTLTVPSATVTKTIADDTLVVGEYADYTATVTLPASINFYDTRVIDTLPDGLKASTLSTTGVTCVDSDAATCSVEASAGTPGTNLAADGQTVGWLLGDLAASTKVRTVTIEFRAKVDDNCTTADTEKCNTIGKSRSNSADVRWNITATSDTDPTTVSDPAGKTSTSGPAVFTVLEPKTAITKSVSNGSPAPGQTFTYTITASNPGGSNVSDAYNVVVKDLVPDGVVVDEDSISGDGEYVDATRTITWEIAGPLASGVANNKIFTYEATLDDSTTLHDSTLKNTADITGFDSLPTGGRHYDGPEATADVTPAFPHVKIAKRVVGSAVSYVGEPQNFEITVTSDGDSAAHDIDVTDLLPKNWEFDNATVKVGSGVALPVPPVNDNGNPQTLTWSDLAPAGLAVGDTIVITYTASPTEDALVDPGAGSDKDHTNTASVVAEDVTGNDHNLDGDYFGDPAEASAQIHAADLEIVKTADGTPVAGKSFSWQLAVTNHGPDPATGPIVVTDEMPAEVSNFSADGGPQWNCSTSTTTIECTHAGPVGTATDDNTLPVITVTGLISADLADGTEITNSASVDGHTYDPVKPDDEDISTVESTTEADLGIVKTLTEGVTAGETATYTLDVTNHGPSVARGPIVVEDTLPAGSTFVSASGSGWETCDESGGVVTCTRSDDLGLNVAAGQITVKVKIPASQTADVVNSATVDGKTPEPDTTPAEENNTDSVTTKPTRTASLFLQKSLKGDDAGDKLVAGAQGTYVLDVSNNGPSTATQVSITDELPGYLTYVSGGNQDWTCTVAEQLVTCDLDGSLAVGDAAATSVELTVQVDSGYSGEVLNVAQVTADEDPTGSTDDDGNTPELNSDLEVEKTHSGDAVAGESLTYDLTVTNHGPSDSDGPIVVEDTVPTGMTYDSLAGTDAADWSCDEDAGVVTCTHADTMVDDQQSSLQLVFDVGTGAGPATVDNLVSVNGPNTDPDPDNNSDTDETSIVDEANVTVKKTAAAGTVDSGSNATWYIDVTNDGPSTADNVTVADVLPPGLGIVSIEGADGSDWVCDTAPLGCTLASLAPGDAPRVTVVTKVGSAVASGETITNPATVATSTDGDDPDDNDSDASIVTTTSADLTLAKTHTGTPVAGEDFTFTLTAHNAGPSDAKGAITITDELPAGMTYVSNNDAWSCEADAVTSSGQEVICTLVSASPIATGADATALNMVVAIAPDQSGIDLVNTADVESTTPDPIDDNDATDTVTPTDEVDLSITKSHTGPVEIGEQLTFTVGVHNAGPSEARDVEIADTLPAGLTYVSANGDGWTCESADASCTLDDPLGPNEDAEPITVTVLVTADAYPGVTNEVAVTTSSHDTDDSDDSDTDDVTVPPKVDLSVVKKLEGSLKVGEDAAYTLTVHNAGPTADPGVVTVTDQLPAGLTYVSGTAAGWTCDEVAGLVTCDRAGDFAMDATEQIVLTVTVGAEAYPSVSNTATVASPADDTDPDNNVSTVTDPVAGTAVLAIDKKLVSNKGDDAVWSIAVTNNGPTETTAPIVVTDKLPAGLKYVDAAGTGWVCDHVGRAITCTYASTLAVDGTASIRIKTTITAKDGEEIVNVASVSGGDASGANTDDGGDGATDDATVTAPDASGGLLPDTGGAELWVLLVGLMVMAGGGFFVTRRRPGTPRGRHL